MMQIESTFEQIGPAPSREQSLPITQPTSRKLQTVMTDRQLAGLGLAIFQPSDEHLLRLVSSKHVRWNSCEPILMDVHSFAHSVEAESVVVAKLPVERDTKFRARLNELAEIAVDEGISLSTQSRACTEQFLSNLPWAKLPGVFLVGNGNFRLVWDKGEERVGFQFLPDGKVQFVILQSSDGEQSHIMGTKSVAQVHRLIDQLGLRAILRP